VEIYAIIVVVADAIVRGATVLLLMSKSSNTHGLWHSRLQRLHHHEEPRGIFDPLQVCRGILKAYNALFFDFFFSSLIICFSYLRFSRALQRT
jgi:hypothetical protein